MILRLKRIPDNFHRQKADVFSQVTALPRYDELRDEIEEKVLESKRD